MSRYSILIKGGEIIDGTGSPPKKGDVAVSKDKIIKVGGNIKNNNADLVVDVSGKYVAPGFIDLTNHSDTHWTIFTEPTQGSLVTQGITTILGGNCGSSLAPLVNADNIEGIQKRLASSRLNIDWQSLKEFLKKLENQKIGVNFATLVGGETLRRGVVGNEPRMADDKEIESMELLLSRALDEGAFGLSFSLGTAHGHKTSENEIKKLTDIVDKKGGLVKHHLEDEGKNILPALSRLISFSKGLKNSKIQISHFKALGKTAWEFFPGALEMIEKERQNNSPLTFDFFPFLRTGSDLKMILPLWVREGGKRKILENINNPEERRNIIAGLKDLTLHYEKITIASTLFDSGSVGRSIKDLAEIAGVAPEEIILNLLEANDLEVAIFNEVISEDNLIKIVKKDYALLASDGVGYNIDSRVKNNLPHPRSFSSFSRFLGTFVREKRLLKWEDAINKMTGKPAEILGIKNRGTIKKKNFADLVVFDPKTIEGSADYQNPYLLSKGIDYVIINGEVALKNGKLTSILPGRILRK